MNLIFAELISCLKVCASLLLMLISHWNNFPISLGIRGLMFKWMLGVLQSKALSEMLNCRCHLKPLWTSYLKREEKKTEEAREIPSSRVFKSSLLQRTKYSCTRAIFSWEKTLLIFFWGYLTFFLVSWRSNTVQTTFLLHPSPNAELPTHLCFQNFLRTQTWRSNPATARTLQLFLDMELCVTQTLHPCSMISLPALSHTLKGSGMTGYWQHHLLKDVILSFLTHSACSLLTQGSICPGLPKQEQRRPALSFWHWPMLDNHQMVKKDLYQPWRHWCGTVPADTSCWLPKACNFYFP